MSKMILNCHDRSTQVSIGTKTRHDNNFTDHIGLVYATTENELSGLIRQGAVYDEN